MAKIYVRKGDISSLAAWIYVTIVSIFCFNKLIDKKNISIKTYTLTHTDQVVCILHFFKY